MNALEIENLTKFYGTKKIIDNLSLTIEKGVVFSILGINGVGKTTLLKCLLDLVRFQEGSIKVMGHSSRDPKARRSLFYVPEHFTFYPTYTVQDALSFMAQMMHENISTDERDRVLQEAGIAHVAHSKTAKLSKGQKQRIALAYSLYTSAELVIFDEPFSGLDPEGIRFLHQSVAALKAKGKTVLFNSHMLTEVEKSADQVMIMYQGKNISSGNVKEILSGSDLEEYFFNVLSGVRS